MSGPRVGVMLPTFRDSPDDALRIAAEAEELGIDGVFVYDHLWPMGRPDRPALSPFPVLGAIAARSARLWLGTLVARVGVVPDEVLIAEFATLAHLAPGRVVAGIGTGDRLSFNENRAYGVALDSAADRRAEVGELCPGAPRPGPPGVDRRHLGRDRRGRPSRSGRCRTSGRSPPGRIAAQAIRSEVSWAGMAAPADGAEASTRRRCSGSPARSPRPGRPGSCSGGRWRSPSWPPRRGTCTPADRPAKGGAGAPGTLG